MNSHVEHVCDVLFPREAESRTGNVKFFRGLNREVTQEQLAQQIRMADEQIANGTATLVEDADAA